MKNETAEALVYTAPGAARIEEVALPPLAPGQATVRTVTSGLSRGTERLVFSGKVPESQWQAMRAPFQSGDFPFPVRYGYCAVGVAEDGALAGRTVFALHPHQTRFRVPESALTPVPDSVPPGRAILAANMETALNATWDARLPPGARVAIVGLGLVGLLVMAILSRRADIHLVVSDIRPETAVNADDFRVKWVKPDALDDAAFDTVFHTSASAGGLATALRILAFEGEVIEMSWFGESVPVPLGEAFHSRRLTIRASQVGHVAPARRAGHSYADRMARAMELLGDPRVDTFVTGEVAFASLPAEIARLLAPDASGIATRIRYD